MVTGLKKLASERTRTPTSMSECIKTKCNNCTYNKEERKTPNRCIQLQKFRSQARQEHDTRIAAMS